MRKLAFFLSLLALLSFAVFAEGEGNMDGGGGDLGSGTGDSFWYAGDDGVRVTVVNANTHTVVKPPVDYSKKNHNDINIHFGKISKLSYNNGTGLTLNPGTYTSKRPTGLFPQIISTGGGMNIEAIKSYFTDRGALEQIAKDTGMEYDTLINGTYKLLIEPMAYFAYNGVNIAATAHEAALYDQIVSGALRSAMGNLTHKNLPLAIFLEKGDLGFPAWTGSHSDFVANSQIISSLGVGVVRFTEDTEPPAIIDADFEYHTDIDVITSFHIYGGSSGVSPDDDGYVTFTVNGSTQGQSYVSPPGDSQLVWFRWHTPKTPQTVNIDVSVTGGGSVTKSRMTARIVELEEKEPPDPKGRDRNDLFILKSPPPRPDVTSLSWGVWIPRWRPNWVWYSEEHDSGCDEDCTTNHGHWVDEGWWEYDWKPYDATISATMLVAPHDIVPTAYAGSYGRTWIKSGYGIQIDVQSSNGGNNGGQVTGAQNVITYFPEFEYISFNRVLESYFNSGYGHFQFKENRWSQEVYRAHYLPPWYPDNMMYEVQAEIIDCWTPAGELRCSRTYKDLWVNESAFDDWRWRTNQHGNIKDS